MGRSLSSRARDMKRARVAPTASMPPDAAYKASMALIRARFLALEAPPGAEAPFIRAERLALHVRKIVEGVAFGALSATEIRNAQEFREQRTKDADKLLTWLHHRGLLRLPQTQRIEPPPSPEFKATFKGAGDEDLHLDTLKAAYSRASALVHERHPERHDQETVEREIALLEEDARRLRAWLWLHITFLGDTAALLQMGQYGTVNFLVRLDRAGPIPPEDAVGPVLQRQYLDLRPPDP